MGSHVSHLQLSALLILWVCSQNFEFLFQYRDIYSPRSVDSEYIYLRGLYLTALEPFADKKTERSIYIGDMCVCTEKNKCVIYFRFTYI